MTPDARWRKVVADLLDLRTELVSSALAVALGSAVVTLWQSPLALVLPLVLLVVAQGGARIGRVRAAEAQLLRAIGAMDGFASTLSGVEGACFSGVAALIGVVLSAIVAALAGTPMTPTLAAVWLVGSTLVGSTSARIASRRGAEHQWSA
jgi:hypothetical protein